MSNVKWTKEQEQAIYQKDKNILVSAAAGSGKTAVLVERILQKILDENNPVNIDELLVVTFTNAAASEMKERLFTAIYKKLDEEPDNNNLKKQIFLLNKAHITTIHSFCLDVIRNNFFEIDIDPNFKIADTTEIELLKLEALEELFEEKYNNSNDDFKELLDLYSNYRSDDGLKELILTIFKFIQSMPFPQKWLKEKIELFNVEINQEFSKTVWGEILTKWISIELEEAKNKLEDISKKLKIDDNPKYLEVVLSDIMQLDDILNALKYSWDNAVNSFEILEFKRLSVSKTGSEELKDLTKTVREEVKKRIKDIKENICITQSKKINQDMNYMYDILIKLKELVLEFENIFKLKKQEKNIIDFNDIEHYALKILVDSDYNPTEVANKYKNKFKEILIDEYQDSNIIQEYILSKISNENNIFMVGDVKQSIYRFRQARPDLFLSKYNTYDEIKEESQYEYGKKIKLFKNFRSRAEVLEFVNTVFEKLMSLDVGELEYTEDEFLNVGADYKQIENKVEVDIISLKETENDENNDKEEADEDIQEERVDNIQLEARLIASRIKKLINDEYKILDKKTGEYRLVQFKDIVILLRSTKNYSDIFILELLRQGIPTFSDTSGEYFNSMEISLIISILKIIDNPMQDIPLIAALRSCIWNFTDSELIDIRLIDRKCNFFEAMQKMLAQKKEGLSEKIEKFFTDLSKWQKMSEYTKIDSLIWQIYVDTGYYEYVSLMPDGKKRSKNLRMLFERATQYEKTSLKGLFNFIKFIDKLILSNSDMSAAKTIGENDNVVRIMSIHKSKGLEFPVVFLSGTGKKFNMQDMGKSLLIHQDIGLGPDYINADRRISYPTMAKLAVKQKMKLELLSEELRILYVALTRAKEKLIITGIDKNLDKSKEMYSNINNLNKIPVYTASKANNFLSWIEQVIFNEWEILNKKLDINFYLKEDILKDIQVEDTKKVIDNLAIPEDVDTTFIDEQLSWKYKNIELSKIPTKLSVSEIKRRHNLDNIEDAQFKAEQLQSEPKFLSGKKKISNAEKGSIVHLIIQHLSLNKNHTITTIKQEIQNMILKNLLTEEEYESIDVNKIYKFTVSDIYKRMTKSSKVYKEQPFYMSLPVNDIYKDIKGSNTILVQGIIDCFFEEDDGLVLIDYKTDYVENNNLESLVEKYSVQLEYYKKALEEATSKKVKQIYIYSLYCNKAIEKQC